MTRYVHYIHKGLDRSETVKIVGNEVGGDYGSRFRKR